MELVGAMGMSPEYHPDTSMTCQVAAEARQVPPFFFWMNVQPSLFWRQRYHHFEPETLDQSWSRKPYFRNFISSNQQNYWNNNFYYNWAVFHSKLLVITRGYPILSPAQAVRLKPAPPPQSPQDGRWRGWNGQLCLSQQLYGNMFKGMT